MYLVCENFVSISVFTQCIFSLHRVKKNLLKRKRNRGCLWVLPMEKWFVLVFYEHVSYIHSDRINETVVKTKLQKSMFHIV